jgi:amino acid transporter
MSGWGLVAATILVLSNLAGIAVEFLFLLIAQITGNPAIADLAQVTWINIAVCLLFMLAATFVSYRDMQTTQKLQYVLVTFQIVVLLFFAVAAIVQAVSGNAFDYEPFDLGWFNPFTVPSFSAFAAGLSLSIFIFWGWDVTLTMNEETRDPEKTPGRAATGTVLIIVFLYLLLSVAMIMFAGVGTGDLGLGNEGIQENVFFYLSGPILGPLAFLVSLAVLTSSASSLQSTFVSPARTLLSMGHYGALPERFSRVSPRFFTPGFATIASSVVASVFYAVMRVVSENVLWDTITALGMMICFYYGLTAFACVWYFRKQWFDSVRNVFFTLVFPLVGGIILAILFVSTLIDSMDPDYGSGSSLFGVGLVFILGVTVILVGVVVMIWQAVRRPAFFRGETLAMDAPPSLRRSRAAAQ